MFKKVLIFVLIIITGLMFTECKKENSAGTKKTITVTDDMDRELTVPYPVKKAVIFNRYNVDYFRAVGGMDVIAGMDAGSAKHKDFFPDFDFNNVVATYQEPNYEKILTLKPDIVVTTRNGNWEKLAEKLETFDIPLVVVTGWDVLKHEWNITLIGKLLGKEKRAEELNNFYRSNMDLVADRLSGIEKKSIYVEKPGPYTTSLQGSGWYDMIVQAGGESIFKDVLYSDKEKNKGSVHEFEIDPEQILLKDPEVIVKFSHYQQYLPPSKEEFHEVYEELISRPGWKNLKAVKNGRLYVISNFLPGSCSKMIGVIHLAKWLYPDTFSDFNPDDRMKEWIEEYQGLTYLGGYVYNPMQ